MSETKPSNPNAFPLVVQKPHGVEYFPGMMLRDYFAAQALPAMLATKRVQAWSYEEIAIATYAMADAMLRAREAQP